MTKQNIWANFFLILLSSVYTNVLAQPKNELRVIAEHLPAHFDYNSSSSAWSNEVLSNLAEGLLVVGTSGELLPGQAESWSISNDGLEYIFKIDRDAYWSDGKPVVAKDFVLAWRRMADPSRNNQNSSYLQLIKNYHAVSTGKQPLEDLAIKALDDKRLLVTLEQPSVYFLKRIHMFRFSPVPSHHTSSEIDRMMSDVSIPMIVNGPYNLENTSSNEITLIKNQLYKNKDQIYYDRIRFTKMEDNDENSALKTVITGEYDMALIRPQEAFHWIRQSYPSYFQERALLNTEYFLFNTEANSITQHAEVRQALSMAIDRNKLSRDIFKGSVVPARTFAPSSVFSTQQPEEPKWAKLPYPTRLKKAALILKKRGITPETPATIEIKTQRYENRHKVATAIKYMWQKIGIEAKIKISSTPETYKDMRKGEYEISRGGWLVEHPDPLNFLNLLASKKPRFSGMPIAPEIDKLLLSATKEEDIEKREILFNKIESVNHAKNIMTPLYHVRDYIPRSPKLQGIGESPFTTSLRLARPKNEQ